MKFRRFLRSVCFVVTALFVGHLAVADEPPGEGTVSYAPFDRTVEGDAPLYNFHTVDIQSPGPIWPGWPTTITPQLVWEVIAKPAGVTDEAALGYVSWIVLPDFTTTPSEWEVTKGHADPQIVEAWLATLAVVPQSVTYSAANQTHTIGIFFKGPTDAVAGDYAYRLKLVGWPGEGGFTHNNGTHINVRVLDPLTKPEPPTVTIVSPAELEKFIYLTGGAPVQVPVLVTGMAKEETPVTQLTATVRPADASGPGTPLDLALSSVPAARVEGGVLLPYTAAGFYTIEATATNDAGSDTKSVTFEVIARSPTPSIEINEPANGQVFTQEYGAPHLNIPFEFITNTSPGFTISAVSATLDGVAVPVSDYLTVGLDTEAAISEGTLTAVPPGVHTLTATGWSAGVMVTTSVTFTVVQEQPVQPPTVVINTPAPDAQYTLGSCGYVVIPLTFTGTSNVADGKITQLTATLGDRALNVYTSGLGQKVAKGTSYLVVCREGTYTISVTATDAVGTAEATQSFTVVSHTKRKVSGLVFLDSNANGTRNYGEAGLGGMTVTLKTSGQVAATTTTAADGTYSFSAYAGSYVVIVTGPKGLSPTTLDEHPITIGGGNVAVSDTGFGLDFDELRTLKACGRSHGFWKSNLSKATSCRTRGAQVSASDLKSYTSAIAGFGLEPFDRLTISQAVSILSATGKQPTAQLSLQLLASEYNFVSGGYINGSKALTQAFVYHGEYVLKNASAYSASYLTFLKDWCDAYNNSYGGYVLGPKS